MKKINLILLCFIIPFAANAAFTEPEMSQLNEINKSYIKKELDARKNLDMAIKESISNLPKEKESILKLNKLWADATKIKCRLMILESLNTDAEISSKYECFANEYKSEADFLNNIY